MSEHKKQMVAALKTVFIPALRQRGFKGSMPHFYRSTAVQGDFLTIQFNSAGGSFVVEIACCAPTGLTSGAGKGLPLQKLNTFYFGADRFRLSCSDGERHNEQWFSFGPRSYEPDLPLQSASYYDDIAASLLPLLETQAEPWWTEHQKLQPS